MAFELNICRILLPKMCFVVFFHIFIDIILKFLQPTPVNNSPMETKKNVFSNEEITVTFNPRKCMHAEKCANGLSQVFRTAIIPWIDLDAAGTQRIAKQVRRCPSGALQCVVHKTAPQVA